MHDHSRRRTFLVRNPSRKGAAASDPIGRRPRPRGCSRPSMSTGRTDRKKYASWHLLSSYRCWRPERAAGRLSARALGLSLFLHRSMETFHRRLSSENKRVWDVCALWRRCRGLWALGAARRVGAENVVIGSQSTLYDLVLYEVESRSRILMTLVIMAERNVCVSPNGSGVKYDAAAC